MLRRIELALAAISVALFGVHPVIRASSAGHGGPTCAGSDVRVAWSPPRDTSGVSGYEIQDYVTNAESQHALGYTARVGVGQDSASVPLDVGVNDVQVWELGTDGTLQQLSDQTYTAGQAPLAATWGIGPWYESNSVADGTATVTFSWPSSLNEQQMGYEADTDVVRLSPSRSVSVSPFQGTATATFTGLQNGQTYTFTSQTSNACGTSATTTSPVFVPGTAPQWTSDTPPTVARQGTLYAYQFAASGKPAPSYQLVGAPAWLHLRGGLVYGTVPAGTTSFTYSVTAYNGVGIQGHYIANPLDRAGPFSVSTSASPSGAKPAPGPDSAYLWPGSTHPYGFLHVRERYVHPTIPRA